MVWPARPQREKATVKEFLEIVQSVVTIAAVIVGGIWTYIIFGKERKQYPHVDIEHKLSHVGLSPKINLLRVGIELSNHGSTRLGVGKWMVRVQQILPLEPCEKNGPCIEDEIKRASEAVVRKTNNFSWPMIAKREENLPEGISVEPEEKQVFEFEFVLPSEVKVARVYSYFRNDLLSMSLNEIGWVMSSYYDFRKPCEGGKK